MPLNTQDSDDRQRPLNTQDSQHTDLSTHRPLNTQASDDSHRHTGLIMLFLAHSTFYQDIMLSPPSRHGGKCTRCWSVQCTEWSHSAHWTHSCWSVQCTEWSQVSTMYWIKSSQYNVLKQLKSLDKSLVSKSLGKSCDPWKKNSKTTQKNKNYEKFGSADVSWQIIDSQILREVYCVLWKWGKIRQKNKVVG